MEKEDPKQTAPENAAQVEDSNIKLSLDGSKEAYACGHMNGYRQGINDVLFWMVAGILACGFSYEIFRGVR